MRSEDTVIAVRNLGKTYRLFNHPGDRVKESLCFGLKKYHQEFVALRDVSFEIERGESVGIVGRNGAGKSTLLQLVCGVLKATTGSVRVDGRVSALLELGTGFHSDFTGRENVFFLGAVMGLSRNEMEKRFDEIASFADIGDYVNQPVRTYSSGMFLRLAFAVAAHVDPEILVVDEALSTGDSAFQDKCLRRMEAIRRDGCTILFVSHSIGHIARFCKRAILLDHGKLVADGPVSRTLSLYLNGSESGREERDEVSGGGQIPDNEGLARRPYYNSAEVRLGDHAATIYDARIIQGGAEYSNSLVPGQRVRVLLDVNFHSDVDRPIYEFLLKTEHGAVLFGTNSMDLNGSSTAQKKGSNVQVCFDFNPYLDAGKYTISLGVSEETRSGMVTHDRRYDSVRFDIAPPLASGGRLALNAEFFDFQDSMRETAPKSADP